MAGPKRLRIVGEGAPTAGASSHAPVVLDAVRPKATWLVASVIAGHPAVDARPFAEALAAAMGASLRVESNEDALTVRGEGPVVSLGPRHPARWTPGITVLVTGGRSWASLTDAARALRGVVDLEVARPSEALATALAASRRW